MLRRTIAGVVALVLRPVRVESEIWLWIREFVTHLPGELGILIRASFYNRYLKRGAADLTILPGAILEHPQQVEFGRKCTVGRNSILDGMGGLSVGDSAGIGPMVFVHTANHEYEDRSKPFLEQGHVLKPVVIEADAWLAARVTVLPGTHVGRGAVIMAGAVISGPIKPYAICGGNPARPIGSRGQAAQSA